jgi:RNA polymerase sigma-70 factor (ECF subfamily)
MGFATSDAEDLAQRALVAYWSKADRVEPGKERAFAHAVLQHEVARDRRAFARRRETAVQDVPPQSTGATRPDELLHQQRELQRAQALLEGIPAQQRLAFALHVVDGLTCEQIAAQQELPVGTVKTRLRAVRKLLERSHSRES